MPTRTPATEISAFVAFAILDELIRTLIDREVLLPTDAVNMLGRIKVTIASDPRHQTTEALALVEQMLREYGKQTR